jgi:hypothetical protein
MSAAWAKAAAAQAAAREAEIEAAFDERERAAKVVFDLAYDAYIKAFGLTHVVAAAMAAGYCNGLMTAGKL